MVGMINRISETALALSSIALLLMMLHVSADVALKYLMNYPIPGTLEIVSAYYMVAGVFLPLAAVELVRASIAVDIGYMFMPRFMKIACMVLVLVGSIAVYGVLAWTSWGDAMRSFRIREVMMGTVFVSVWPSRLILPISFALAGLICLWHFWRFLSSKEARDAIISHTENEEAI